MTISGTVIMLEAAGNMVYLLPLMVTFGAARYTGEEGQQVNKRTENVNGHSPLCH